MKRVRIEKPKRRVERWWLEILPLDPRDPDVVCAKAINWARRSDGTGMRGSRDEARRGLAPRRDATEWFARALRDRGMPPSEVRAVLKADDHLIVRRYFELHRERLVSVSRSRSGTSSSGADARGSSDISFRRTLTLRLTPSRGLPHSAADTH
jgi:hypothetical protein